MRLWLWLRMMLWLRARVSVRRLVLPQLALRILSAVFAFCLSFGDLSPGVLFPGVLPLDGHCASPRPFVQLLRCALPALRLVPVTFVPGGFWRIPAIHRLQSIVCHFGSDALMQGKVQSQASPKLQGIIGITSREREGSQARRRVVTARC
jgi:hypothetical protein